MEYVSEGKTLSYIAETLKVNDRTVDRDIRYLKNDTGVTDWLDKKLPFEYRKGLTTYDRLASKMWDIVNDDTVDPRIRVGAGSVIANVTDRKLALIGGRETLKRTVTLITRLKEQHGLPQGSTPQNSKQTIVTEEETRVTSSDSVRL